VKHITKKNPDTFRLPFVTDPYREVWGCPTVTLLLAGDIALGMSHICDCASFTPPCASKGKFHSPLMDSLKQWADASQARVIMCTQIKATITFRD
jgi:hypothetical protein